MTSFCLPMNNAQHYRLDPVVINVLCFDPTGDLLATGDSTCVLQVYSFQQNTFVLRRKFQSSIRAIEWKTKSHFNGFLGHCRLYLGFEDNSISYITFPSKLYPFEIESGIIDTTGPGGPIRRLVYGENRLISCDSGSVTFWSDNHSCDLWNKRKTMTFAELSPGGQDIENIVFDAASGCIFILLDGYILHMDVVKFEPLWAARPTKEVTMIRSALSSCGQFMVLALPHNCRFKQILGSNPPLKFIYGPPRLRELHALPIKDLYMALDSNNNIVTWNGGTGVVYHYVNRQDFEQPFFSIAGTALNTVSLLQGTDAESISITVAAVTVDDTIPDRSSRRIRVWNAVRREAGEGGVTYPTLSSKVQIVKNRQRMVVDRMPSLRASIINKSHCRGFCRKTKNCIHRDI